MGAREEIQKRIEKKRGEIGALETEILSLRTQVREAASYVQALEDALKLLPRDGGDFTAPAPQDPILRPGSAVAKVKDLLEKAGRPMHINELLTALGKPLDTTTRSGLSGSISAYVRDGKIFTRPAPNTFGLKGMAKQGVRRSEPPPNFGIDEPIEDIESREAEPGMDAMSA